MRTSRPGICLLCDALCELLQIGCADMPLGFLIDKLAFFCQVIKSCFSPACGLSFLEQLQKSGLDCREFAC